MEFALLPQQTLFPARIARWGGWEAGVRSLSLGSIPVGGVWRESPSLPCLGLQSRERSQPHLSVLLGRSPDVLKD